MTRDERSATLRAGCASSAPADARAFVARTGQTWELPEPVIEAAQLATSELVSNSVEHALSGVQVTLALAGDQLRIAVRDHSKAPPVRRVPNTSGARGRGIALVEAVAEEWGVLPHPDGKTVWLVLPATGNGLMPFDGATQTVGTATAASAAQATRAEATAPTGGGSDSKAATVPAAEGSVLERPEVVEVPQHAAE